MRRQGVRQRCRHVVVGTAFAVAAVALAPHAGVAADKGTLKRFGLVFPARIGGTDRGVHTDFEKKQAGLGHSVEYDAPHWTVTVYIYDKKQKAIPEEVESGAISKEFEAAKGDIFRAEEKGYYSDVALNGEFLLADLSGQNRFQCASFGFVHKKRGDVDSFLCVTSWLGKFVKMRATADRSDGTESAFRQYMGAWIEHLWPGR
jgi:hypothetical protein